MKDGVSFLGRSSKSSSGKDSLKMSSHCSVICQHTSCWKVEQSGASTKEGHKELARDIFVLQKLHRFLQGKKVLLSQCFGTAASWQQCFDYNATGARLSEPRCSLSRADVPREKHPPLTKHINKLKPLSCRIVSIPVQPSHHNPLRAVAAHP